MRPRSFSSPAFALFRLLSPSQLLFRLLRRGQRAKRQFEEAAGRRQQMQR